jgi:tellurite methyltransferase
MTGALRDGVAAPYHGAMRPQSSVAFFDEQFQRQLHDHELALNPFEQKALAVARGKTLDYGCGLGNFALAAARQGCSVLALDASPTAIAHLRDAAREQALAVEAREADLSRYTPEGDYDTVVCIGLLMFFDCDTARVQLGHLQRCIRPGGVVVVNVLVEGTTYMDMFDPAGHCLFRRDELAGRFAGWEILEQARQDFPAPAATLKSFVTLLARKPPR